MPIKFNMPRAIKKMCPTGCVALDGAEPIMTKQFVIKIRTKKRINFDLSLIRLFVIANRFKLLEH